MKRQPNRLRAFKRKQSLAAAANAEPLPGPLAEAFAGVPSEIAGLKVRPLVHWDFVILRRLDSPLLKHLGADMANGQKSKQAPKTSVSDDEASEAVFLFTRPCEDVDSLIEQKGLLEFRRQARRQIGMKLGPVEVQMLMGAIANEFVRYFSTAVKYVAKAGADGTTTFTPPPAQPTASAGGSTTSAG